MVALFMERGSRRNTASNLVFWHARFQRHVDTQLGAGPQSSGHAPTIFAAKLASTGTTSR